MVLFPLFRSVSTAHAKRAYNPTSTPNTTTTGTR
jgi:hypothetical protein